MENFSRLQGQTGAALLITLIALVIFSILGLFMTLSATTDLNISDNYESQLQATYAAIAGLNHARALLRGLPFDDPLKGPDGAYDKGTTYMAYAKGYAFRSPLPLLTGQSLNILDPSSDVSGFPDNGLINTGFYESANGTELIPLTGISMVAPNPYGLGSILTSRYFVKVSDNNGDTAEIAGDSQDNPFVDGDGTIIVRSMGIARTMSEVTGLVRRLNSVAVFEARFRRLSTWNLGPALTILGDGVTAAFSGSYEISGGLSPGIGTIDTVPGDTIFLDQIIRAAAGGSGSVSGAGQPNPSVQEIAGQVQSNPDQSLLLDPRYLWDFIHSQSPKWADIFFDGSQNWLSGVPYVGSYDSAKPPNAPGQDPKITVVNGDLQVSDGFSGGGLLIVTGDFSCSGSYAYSGLVLVIGSGNLTASGSGQGIEGGLVAAKLVDVSGTYVFGAPSLSIGNSSRFTSNKDVVKMAIALIPAAQISFREIAGSDP